jgi:hypothetical protein
VRAVGNPPTCAAIGPDGANGEVATYREAVAVAALPATIGLAHTRWRRMAG